MDEQALDYARLARHQRLIEMYEDVAAEELLIDLVVLVQMAAFKQRQEKQDLKEQQ